MVTPLEKARKDPDSMKARILKKARCVFGEYGFHGATTRMIAEEVGVDISTLYYHWGEKSDLYQAVITDINDDLRAKLVEVEHRVRGLPLDQRMRIAIDMTTDYLFQYPETSNLVLFRYFAKTRDESIVDLRVPEFVSDIARSMGLCAAKHDVPTPVRMRVLAMMNAIHNFVSGQSFFRGMLEVEREEYITLAKETLKFILVPAFAGAAGRGDQRELPDS
jgi:TetR/AcrR family transcriptional regulator, regulator of cefoperazone and chloramphenicol sensitivity